MRRQSEDEEQVRQSEEARSRREHREAGTQSEQTTAKDIKAQQTITRNDSYQGEDG